MIDRKERSLARLMRVEDCPAPPAGLIDGIVAGIPDVMPRPALPATEKRRQGYPLRSPDVTWRRRSTWLVAACVAWLLVGGGVAYRLAWQVTVPTAGGIKHWVSESRWPAPPTIPSRERLAAASIDVADVSLEAPRALPTPREAIDDSQPAASFSEEMTVVSTLLTITSSVSLSSATTYSSGRPAGKPLPASTGGNAEPNDAPYGDVFFEAWGTNPFVDTEDDPLSTFGVDVDTASYTVMRRYLEGGDLPPRDAVRVEEVVNYFDYGLPAPPSGDFTIRVDGGPTPFTHGNPYRLLRIGLRAREVENEARKPATLTFVVDVSGSMNIENRLGLVKQALGLLLDQLRPNDRVALVVYGSRATILLNHTADLEAIRRAIAELEAEGSTFAEEGLVLAYELAAESFREGAINRVVLCSDGVANVGATGADSILERISEAAGHGIELSTVGFGMGNYNDTLMEQLADRGNGNYAYVDTLAEARRIFVEELTGTLQTVAAEARVQLELNPHVVERYRLLGYENRDIADEDFRNDRVDGGEVGAGHTVTALYEVKLRRGAPRWKRLATVRLRYRPIDAAEFVEIEKPVRRRHLSKTWKKSAPGMRLAAVVAELAEILRQSYWARGSDASDLLREAEALASHFAGDASYEDLVVLVRTAARLGAGVGQARGEGSDPEQPMDTEEPRL